MFGPGPGLPCRGRLLCSGGQAGHPSSGSTGTRPGPGLPAQASGRKGAWAAGTIQGGQLSSSRGSSATAGRASCGHLELGVTLGSPLSLPSPLPCPCCPLRPERPTPSLDSSPERLGLSFHAAGGHPPLMAGGLWQVPPPPRHLLAPGALRRGSPSPGVHPPHGSAQEQPLPSPLPTLPLSPCHSQPTARATSCEVLGPQSQAPTPVRAWPGGARQAGPSPSLGPGSLSDGPGLGES